MRKKVKTTAIDADELAGIHRPTSHSFLFTLQTVADILVSISLTSLFNVVSISQNTFLYIKIKYKA